MKKRCSTPNCLMFSLTFSESLFPSKSIKWFVSYLYSVYSQTSIIRASIIRGPLLYAVFGPKSGTPNNFWPPFQFWYFDLKWHWFDIKTLTNRTLIIAAAKKQLILTIWTTYLWIHWLEWLAIPVLTKCRTPLLYADLYYTRIFRPKFGTPNYRV